MNESQARKVKERIKLERKLHGKNYKLSSESRKMLKDIGCMGCRYYTKGEWSGLIKYSCSRDYFERKRKDDICEAQFE